MKRKKLWLTAVAGGVMICSTLVAAEIARSGIGHGAFGAYGWGGMPGFGQPTTAAGAAMSGMSQVISAAGQYNEQSSVAAINMTVAQKQALENDMLATQTYFAMRTANRAAKQAESTPRLTMEQLVKIAREGAPKPLSSSQQDPVSGGLRWPSGLQQNSFNAGRDELDELFARRAKYGGLTFSDQMQAKQTVNSMFDELKSQIKQIPPQEYVACREFLRSLTFAAAKSDL